VHVESVFEAKAGQAYEAFWTIAINTIPEGQCRSLIGGKSIKWPLGVKQADAEWAEAAMERIELMIRVLDCHSRKRSYSGDECTGPA
jgi:hypothetical protein